MSVEMPAIALWAARRSVVAAPEKVAGLGVPAAGRSAIASLAIRNRRCWKRQAPVTPDSVHSRSRSGGLSDSMNQRAVSAP